MKDSMCYSWTGLSACFIPVEFASPKAIFLKQIRILAAKNGQLLLMALSCDFSRIVVKYYMVKGFTSPTLYYKYFFFVDF